MRRISGPLTLAGFIGLALACQESDAPTTSSKQPERGAQGDGKVTAADGSFPSPGNIPSNPSPGNVPSMPSPGGGLPSNPSPGNPPSNPSPGNVPSQPSPANPPSFPSPAGGGSTPTPTPGSGTPTATPTGGTGTPTGTPGTGICPATLTAIAPNMPFNTTTNDGTGPRFQLTGLTSNCRIVNVRSAIRVTAPNLAVSTSSGQTRIGLFIEPTVLDFALIDLGATTDLPLTGTQMGTTCPNSNLRFVEGNPAFSNATPPYVGIFRPFGTVTTPGGTGNFNRFDGQLANNTIWALPFFRLNSPVTVECWRVELDLAPGAPPTSPLSKEGFGPSLGSAPPARLEY